jgi:hypothetical protein
MRQEQEEKDAIVHRLLDNENESGEEEHLRFMVEADAGLREKLDSLRRAVGMVEESERMKAPPFFTTEVMGRLPAKKAGSGVLRSAADFLVRGRVLKWNMAGALGAVLSLTLLILAVSLYDRTHGPGRHQEQVVLVTMNFYAPEAKQVSVAGTFNKWKTDADLLRRGEAGFWTISIPLEPGDYTYMFVVDGNAWMTDPNAESYRDDGFGFQNAVLRVKT